MAKSGRSWSGVGAWGEVIVFDGDGEPDDGPPEIERYPSARALKRSKKRLGPPRAPVAPVVRGPDRSAIGARGESRAVSLLVAKGFRIIERNFKTKVGELDIVAMDGGTLVFVEVRARAHDAHGTAIDSVTRGKRERVTRTALQYLQWRRPTFTTARFDVVAITGDEIVHVVDAWRLEGARY